MATMIGLDEFIDEWVPGMMEDNILSSIFWNNKDSIVVEVSTMVSDLEYELDKY